MRKSERETILGQTPLIRDNAREIRKHIDGIGITAVSGDVRDTMLRMYSYAQIILMCTEEIESCVRESGDDNA